MANNNSKYTPEYRQEICQLIISSGRSATSIAEEMGIDKNTFCSWMRDYRKESNRKEYRYATVDRDDRTDIQSRNCFTLTEDLNTAANRSEECFRRMESGRAKVVPATLTIMHAWRAFLPQQKKELIYHKKYAIIDEVGKDVTDYIEKFYNRKRLHSYPGYMSPVEFRLKNCA